LLSARQLSPIAALHSFAGLLVLSGFCFYLYSRLVQSMRARLTDTLEETHMIAAPGDIQLSQTVMNA